MVDKRKVFTLRGDVYIPRGWCSFLLQLHGTKPRAARTETADWSPVTDLSPILDVSPTLERAEQELMQRFQVNPPLHAKM